MLADSKALATIAVKDMSGARKFYEGTLGLQPNGSQQQDAAVQYGHGSSTVLVYRSEFAGSNKATAVTWVSPDVAAAVGDLKRRGVAFEHYDMPGARMEGDVHVMGTHKAAWFKDPEGNILAIVSA
jgi:catechol-2,3-dioxygenase